MQELFTVDSLISLLTLTVLEIVLGIDNIVFISILSGKLPADQQKKARRLGLSLAMFIRVLLLLSISWIMSLTNPLFNMGDWIGIQNPKWLEMTAISGRDLILIVGGLFLIYKSTSEIHEKLEGDEGHASARVAPSFAAVVGQIMVLDVVFSLDSVITAVGMADQLWVMVTAVILAVGIMLWASEGISSF